MLKIFIILYFFLQVSVAVSETIVYTRRNSRSNRTCECGISHIEGTLSSGDTRIIGGKEVKPPYKYPWMVAIFANQQFQCTGALVSSEFVLTAAHCLVSGQIGKFLDSEQKMCLLKHTDNPIPCYLRISQLKVAFVGPFRYLMMYYPIHSFVRHPKFNYFRKHNDIALIRLKTPAPCDKYNSPICLPTQEQLKVGMKAVISGWGRTHTEGIGPYFSDVLMEAKVKVKPQSYCSVNKKKICLKGNRQGSCTGDSGSPLIVQKKDKFYVYGVLSYGLSPKCLTKKPQIFTRVRKYLSWIMREISTEDSWMTRVWPCPDCDYEIYEDA